jgi:LacI family transcriptional regulator
MRQVAAAAGVSHVTVSRALRNDRDVSAATARRIQLLARRLGYQPNPLVTALMSQVRSRRPSTRHPAIGYLNTWWPRAAWQGCSTKTAQFLGAERRAAELGYRLENLWLREPGLSPQRVNEILRARGVRGLLVGPIQHPDQPLSLPWSQFTLATISYSLRSPEVHRACHAHFRGMYRAMDELIGRGCTRIGFVTSREFEFRVHSLWEGAYRVSQLRLPRAGRLEPLVFPREAEPAALRTWLRAARPDVVINAVPGVYELLLGFGLRLPQDLGFVHLDLSPRLKDAGVTGIDQLSGIVGAAALELVVNQLNRNLEGPPEHPVTQLIEGDWVEGQTLPPAAPPASPAAVTTALSAPLGGTRRSGRSAVRASGRRSGG